MIRNRRTSKQLTLGTLISALYDEAKRITRDRRLQACYVQLALLDMQRG